MEKNNLGVITIDFHERMRMSRSVECPNCQGSEFQMRSLKLPKNPRLPCRVIIECLGCGYWTDWFDGWTWYPKELLGKR